MNYKTHPTAHPGVRLTKAEIEWMREPVHGRPTHNAQTAKMIGLSQVGASGDRLTERHSRPVRRPRRTHRVKHAQCLILTRNIAEAMAN